MPDALDDAAGGGFVRGMGCRPRSGAVKEMVSSDGAEASTVQEEILTEASFLDDAVIATSGRTLIADVCSTVWLVSTVFRHLVVRSGWQVWAGRDRRFPPGQYRTCHSIDPPPRQCLSLNFGPERFAAGG
jgi:hypothetical protein